MRGSHDRALTAYPKKTHRRPRQGRQTASFDILQVMDNPELFGRWFEGPSWNPWRVFLAALFGLPMTPAQAAFYQQCTGRADPPKEPSKEAWVIAGRRAGKSAVLAFIAAYLACFKDYTPYLKMVGERATIRIMSADRDQSRVIFRYLTGFLTEIPLLAKLVSKQTSEQIELNNRVTIEIGTANFRTSRGYTFAAILCDEIAFWHSEDSANPDTEVLGSVRPAQSTIPTSMLLCASSPYARKGELFKSFDRYFGKDNGPLIWRAATRVMNETVPQSFIDEETAKDPTNAASEYGAEFRTDIEAFVNMDAVRACLDNGVRERGPDYRWRYYAFVDPSGGSADSMALCLAHKEGNTVILDLIREIPPPFSPEAAVEEFTPVLKRYRITKVFGDRYAGEWPRERFRQYGVNYELIDFTKSELYQALLPLINSCGVRLLDNDRQVYQLVSLERRTARGGRDSIDHPRGAHDDVANAVAGAVVLASTRPSGWKKITNPFGGGSGSPPPEGRPFVNDPSTNWLKW